MQVLYSDESSVSQSFLNFKGESLFITDSSSEYDDVSSLNLFPCVWSPPKSIVSTNEEIVPKEIKINDSPKIKECEESNNTILKKKRKRGRKNNKEECQHNEFKNDNKMAKIQIGYFSFIITFINSIMKLLNLNYYFIELNGKDKSNINQKHRDCLNKKTIKEIILETPISGRFK